MARDRLDNGLVRRLFLHRHLLGQPPAGPGKGADLLSIITQLGFVQVDSVSTVERAHHMILFSRRPSYRPAALTRLLEKDRSLFEHWTHDASVIPTAFYPQWSLRFDRARARLTERWKKWRGDGYRAELDRVLDHVRDNGVTRSAELMRDADRGKSGGWWNWHPSKTALEFHWQTGALAIHGRQGFQKIYDLAERCYPQACAAAKPAVPEAVDWFCEAAMDRLGFATPGEIAAFWAHVSPAEARDWAGRALATGCLQEVDVIGVDGAPRRSLARPGVVDEARDLPPPPGRIRILSPFDPALRDRKRAERLFGFHYRIEIFVPEAKRQYGYYVFPVLEGDRMIGRIDMKADRQASALNVTAMWLEPGVQASKGRLARLEAELARMARFAGCDRVVMTDGWLR